MKNVVRIRSKKSTITLEGYSGLVSKAYLFKCARLVDNPIGDEIY
jgi:hypothetical protein